MPSPFPGMDPYLERKWSDIHMRLIMYLCDQIEESLPRGLRARVEERLYLESPDEAGGEYVADVAVIESGRVGAERPVARGGVQVAAPVVLELEFEPARQRYIEILEVGPGHRVVTAIEVLSPSHKRRGPNRKSYFRKQRDLRLSGISSVEIDLLRAGRRVRPIPASRLAPGRRADYLASVRRGRDTSRFELYPIDLRHRLPIIAVPLREGEADAPLDLQAPVDRAYVKGRYDDEIDYRDVASPPLTPADGEWADALLRAAGRR